MKLGQRVRAFWVSTQGIAENPEKHISELKEMGAEELFLISIEGDGALYPSKSFISSRSCKEKDLFEPVLKEAKKNGLRVHAWVVAFNKPNQDLVREKKQWFVVNRNGESCVDKPAYVPHYLWLCPSREDTRSFLLSGVQELLERYDLDGVHLDYIRLPDIFLPEGLRPKYGIEKGKDEYGPHYDYCYCQYCRDGFKGEYGVDPLEIQFGTRFWYQWVQWRADRITAFVRDFHKVVKSYDNTLETSAAVFATPGTSYRYVFQQWARWPLDSLQPMIYHEYYDRGVDWIGEAVLEGVSTGKKIVAGIFLGFMKTEEDVMRATQVALEKGAQGICWFVYPIPKAEHKNAIRNALAMT